MKLDDSNLMMTQLFHFSLNTSVLAAQTVSHLLFQSTLAFNECEIFNFSFYDLTKRANLCYCQVQCPCIKLMTFIYSQPGIFTTHCLIFKSIFALTND